MKLREIYEKVYRKNDFSFFINSKEYSKCVISVTFQYSLKEFNMVRKGLYVKYGYALEEIQLVDCVCVRAGELIAVQTGEQITSPAPDDTLGKHFKYDLTTNTYVVGANPVLMTVSDLRREIYKSGFVCDGTKYVRYKRSAGSSRVGHCLFIDEALYSRIFTWSKCGLNVRVGKPIDLAAFESSIALTLSSIIDTLELRPENILVVDDAESTFEDTASVTRLAPDGKLDTRCEVVAVTNKIWDGQSLIDQSAMGAYKEKGFVLLRNRFFKSACFNCNLQQWFADKGITSVSQLSGYTRATDIGQIKLVTTPSSIKYLKFGTLDEWLDRLEPTFGVVKHEKPTHYFDGRLVQTHYQLLNSLCLTQEDVDVLLEDSLEYVNLLRNDPEILRFHIKYSGGSITTAAESKNEIVYKLLGLNNRFCETELYYDFVRDIVDSYIKNLRCGHVLVPGTYATMVGNPIEMLLSAIGQFDGQSRLGVGNVHSIRFAYGQRVLGSRSPHVTMGNVWVPMNVEDEEIDRYLNLTNEIVCVNTIGENVMNRLSGCDFDSDTVLLSDHPLLVRRGVECQRFYVPTHMVEAKKIKRHYSIDDQASLDVAASVNKIGEIVNLSQELNSLIWDRVHRGATFEEILPVYLDTAQLDVLSNIEIDKAKREYAVDSIAEIQAIKQRYGITDDDGRAVKPNFFGAIAKTKGYYDPQRKAYKPHQTSMDYLQKTINRHKYRYLRKKTQFLPFSDLLCVEDYDSRSVNYQQVERILEVVRGYRAQLKGIWSQDGVESVVKWEQAEEARLALAEYVRKMRLTKSTMIRLLRSLDDVGNSDVSRILFYTLFAAPCEDLCELLNEAKTPLAKVVEEDGGDVVLYGFRFSKKEVS